MAISFDSIPSSIRTPLFVAEFSNAGAIRGARALAYRALLLGQKTAAGLAAANSLVLITSKEQAAEQFGPGSQLARMAEAWFASNRAMELWAGVLADDGAGVAATCTLTFTGPASAAGTLSVYIGGRVVRVAVTATMVAADIAAALVAAITALTSLPVTAAVGGTGSEHIVTLTAKNKGLVANGLDVSTNYQTGEALPAGVGVTITEMSGGTTAPDFATLFTAMADEWFNVIATPYVDATSYAALKAELADRAGPMRGIDAKVITGVPGKDSQLADLATLMALGDAVNSQHIAVLEFDESITAVEESVANAAAQIASSAELDPARPLQTLPLPWVKPSKTGKRLAQESRNQLLAHGIATTKVVGSDVQLDRVVTTYTKNAAGAADDSYAPLEIGFQLMLARWRWVQRLQLKYARHKLGDDGVLYPPGEPIMTPALGAAEAVAWFKECSSQSPIIFEASGLEQFKSELVVERDATSRDRLNFLLPPDLMNQFVVGAAQIRFVL